MQRARRLLLTRALPRALALLAAPTVPVLLAGCGFQLRGSANLPFASLYVNTASSSQLGNELKRYLRAGSGTVITDNPKAAQAILDILSEARAKDILSLNSAGRVREYTLHYSVNFRIHDGKGREHIAPTLIALKREISFNESAILANESEEGLMYRDMQSDVVQQMLRRMAAIKLG